MHHECQNRPENIKRSNENLNLPHEREHAARSAVDRKSGVDPALGAALDQDAVITPGAFELLDGFCRPRACLAENIDGRAMFVLREKGADFELAEGNRFRAWHMRTRIFWRGANIQQFMGIAEAENCRERGGRDAS